MVGVVADKLRRFGTQFIAVARERLEASYVHVGSDAGAAELRTQLHALAGEAAMLRIAEFAEAARQVEADANRWLAQHDQSARVKAARGLRQLTRWLDEFERVHLSETEAATARPATPTGARVLIIDDSGIVREHLRDALVDVQIDAATAGDLESALAAARANRPELVIADVNMPGIDCDELCAQLRQATHPVRIMLVSGLADAELAERARRAGAELWASKHNGLERVVERITEALAVKP
jgi:CheY-like chemotaxis protein